MIIAPTTSQEQLRKSQNTILHVLHAICEDPAKYYLMGGRYSGSFSRLIETYAALTGGNVEKLYAAFKPHEERYNAYLQQREEEQGLLDHCRDKGIRAASEE